VPEFQNRYRATGKLAAHADMLQQVARMFGCPCASGQAVALTRRCVREPIGTAIVSCAGRSS
jgi:hypothetical protein